MDLVKRVYRPSGPKRNALGDSTYESRRKNHSALGKASK